MTQSYSHTDGRDYVVKIVQHLEIAHGIRFFITTRDFDVVYRWWEKRIPYPLLTESIENVVSRRRARNLPVKGFSNFYYEVKKNFEAFLQLNVGEGVELGGEQKNTAGDASSGSETDKPDAMKWEKHDTFLAQLPEPLAPLRPDFEALLRGLKEGAKVEPGGVLDRLVELFREDEELDMKVRVFIKSLAPPLQTPAIEHKYRLNYLKNKFRLPDFG